MTASAAAIGLLAEVNYRRLPVARSLAPHDGGRVTIVIPARNEAHRIGPLLESLQRLDYVNVEVLVVDDMSEDDTAEIARRGGVRVLSLDHLPTGWTGKCHACWQGALHSSGEWLLFTDADTIHSPASLTVAIAAAADRRAAMVSFLCRQQCLTFWERLILPYAYALYFAGRLRVNTSARTGVANGQYTLVRRSEYERIGGHAAIRASVIDDVALAQRAVASGMRVELMRGEEWVSVRMYDGLSRLWQGLSKNAVYFLAASPVFGALTVAASLTFGATTPGAALADTHRRRAALMGVPAMALLPWLRRFGVPPAFALLHPLAAGIFQLIALDSMRRSGSRGGVQWKGRRY